jgi:hypothetical protein
MVLLDHGGRDAREVAIVAPPADLAGAIEHLWVANGTDATASPWRVVPDASSHVIATVTARAHRRTLRVVVVGARSCAADIDVRNRILTVGLRLRHGALPFLTRASARELVDRSVPVDDVLATAVLRDLEFAPDAPAAVILDQLVRRLHAALRAARDERRSWCEIAHAAGYADQAHLTRDVRALLGEPPSAWAARGSAVSFKTPDPSRS